MDLTIDPEQIDIWQPPPRGRGAPDPRLTPLLKSLTQRAQLLRERGTTTRVQLAGCRSIYWIDSLQLYLLAGHSSLVEWGEVELERKRSNTNELCDVGRRLHPEDIGDAQLGLTALIFLARLPPARRPAFRAVASVGISAAELKQLFQMLRGSSASAPEDDNDKDDNDEDPQDPPAAPEPPARAAKRPAPRRAITEAQELIDAELAELAAEPAPPPLDEQIVDATMQAVRQLYARAALTPLPKKPPPAPPGMELEMMLIHADMGTARPAPPQPPPPDPAALAAAEAELRRLCAERCRDDGQEYAPLPLADEPDEDEDDARLPSGAVPGAPGCPLWTTRYFGCGQHVPLQFGLFGSRVLDDHFVSLSYDDCLALALIGPPGEGKTYGAGVYVEGGLRSIPGVSHIEEPLGALAFHYHPSAAYEPEFLASVYPNQVPAEVARLQRDSQALPSGIADLVLLTLPSHVLELRLRYPHCQVHGIQFALHELGLPGLRFLLGIEDGQETLYSRQVEAMLQQMLKERRPLTFANLVQTVREYPFGTAAQRLLLARLRLVRPWIDDTRCLRDFIKPGRLVQVDIRGDWISRPAAMMLIALLAHVLLLRPPPEGRRRPKMMVVFDEFHRYAKNPLVIPVIDTIIRERRHLDLNPVLLSQDPGSIQEEWLPQFDGVGVLRHDSAAWKRRLGGALGAFARLPRQLTRALRPGQMAFYMKRWLRHSRGEFIDEEGQLMLLALRARVAQHGGATPKAVADPVEERPIEDPGRGPRPFWDLPEEFWL